MEAWVFVATVNAVQSPSAAPSIAIVIGMADHLALVVAITLMCHAMRSISRNPNAQHMKDHIENRNTKTINAPTKS